MHDRCGRGCVQDELDGHRTQSECSPNRHSLPGTNTSSASASTIRAPGSSTSPITPLSAPAAARQSPTGGLLLVWRKPGRQEDCDREDQEGVTMEVDELDFLSSSTLHRCVRSAGLVRTTGQRRLARWHPRCTGVGGSSAGNAQGNSAWRSIVTVRRYAVHAVRRRRVRAAVGGGC